jgi:hypothetical protein
MADFFSQIERDLETSYSGPPTEVSASNSGNFAGPGDEIPIWAITSGLNSKSKNGIVGVVTGLDEVKNRYKLEISRTLTLEVKEQNLIFGKQMRLQVGSDCLGSTPDPTVEEEIESVDGWPSEPKVWKCPEHLQVFHEEANDIASMLIETFLQLQKYLHNLSP